MSGYSILAWHRDGRPLRRDGLNSPARPFVADPADPAVPVVAGDARAGVLGEHPEHLDGQVDVIDGQALS
jgi:hypothetical protein